jgi:hypothetical protein
MAASYLLPEEMDTEGFTKDKTVPSPGDDTPTNQPTNHPTKQTNKSLSRGRVLLHKTICM